MTAQEMAKFNLSYGMRQIPSMAELDRELAELGYKRLIGSHADCQAKMMTGELAGESYPCRTHYIIHIESKLGFANVDAPRDSNFEKLQDLRGSVFVLHGGKIHSI